GLRRGARDRGQRSRRMNILVTNDDGVTAPALYLLRQELSDLGQVHIVAPDRDQSAMSHSITLSRPMRIERPEPGVYAVEGTPTDCVVAGTAGLLSDPGGLLLSGVDPGATKGAGAVFT